MFIFDKISLIYPIQYRLSDIVSHKIVYTIYGQHKDHPPGLEPPTWRWVSYIKYEDLSLIWYSIFIVTFGHMNSFRVPWDQDRSWSVRTRFEVAVNFMKVAETIRKSRSKTGRIDSHKTLFLYKNVHFWYFAQNFNVFVLKYRRSKAVPSEQYFCLILKSSHQER